MSGCAADHGKAGPGVDTGERRSAREFALPGRTGIFGSRWTRVAGCEIHHRASLGPQPDAIPLVLVHGIASSLYLMPLGVRLAPHRPVCIPDLPGFGESWRPPRPLAAPELADALAHWMEAAGIERAHLAGNSLVCNILVEAAIRWPERIASVALQGLTLGPELRKLRALLPRAAFNRALEFPPPPVMREAQSAVETARLLQGTHDILTHRLEERLPLVRRSALLVYGTRDPLFPESWVRRALSLLPDGQSAEVPFGTHTLNVTAPESFAAALLSFVAEVDGRAGGPPRPRAQEIRP